MVSRRVLLVLALPLVSMLALPCHLHGQEVDAPQGPRLLEEGIRQFQGLEFPAAKETLLRVEPAELTDAQRQQLEQYLARVDRAIEQQAQALAAYSAAEQALAANQLEDARNGFAIAAGSEYLPGSRRQQARDQLREVSERIRLADEQAQAAQAATAPEPPAPQVDSTPIIEPDVVIVPRAVEPIEPPAPAPVVEPQPAPAPVVVVEPQPTAEPVVVEPAAVQPRATEQANDLVLRGNRALEQGRTEEAQALYVRALELQSGLVDAELGLREAERRLARPAEVGLLPQFIQQREIRRQQADFQFDTLIAESRQTLAAAQSLEDFRQAESQAQSARAVIERARADYTTDEFADRMRRVDLLLAEIERTRLAWQRQQEQIRRDEVEAAVRAQIEQERREREARIRTLEQRARTLIEEMRHADALQEVQEILRLDPRNSYAQNVYIMLEQMNLLRQERRFRQTRNIETQRHQVGVREAEVPWYELVMYPEDWLDLSARREPFTVGRAETELDREVNARLRQILPTVEFPGVDFRRVVTYLQEVGNLNVVVNEAALQQAGLVPEMMVVNLRLQNVSVEKVLRLVLDQVAGGIAELSYIVDEGVITISTRDDLRRRTLTNVYDIRDLIYRVPNVGQPSGLGLQRGRDGGSSGRSGSSRDSGGGWGGGGGGWGGGGDVFGGGGSTTSTGGNQTEEVSRRELIQGIIDTIKETIDPQSWQPVGLIGAVREMQGQLIVTQTAENHAALLDLINKLREARAIQIAIEARFITVSTGFLNTIGIDLDFYFNLGSRLGSGTVNDPWTGAVVPTRTGQSGWGPNQPGNDKWTPIPIRQGSQQFAGGPVPTPILGGTSIGTMANTAALSVFGSFLDDIQVDFLLSATQASHTTRTLTAPRITLFNGQAAEIIVETQQAYIADLSPEVTENAVAWDIEIDEVATGTRLWVEATVSADRRYVTITVVPQVTQLISLAFFPYDPTPLIAAGTFPPAEQAFIQLPILAVQTLQTTVSVPDGGTLLLGGQRLSGEVEREMGPPVLSKIPIINRAFVNRTFVRDEQTMLILIKPRIIIQREEEERAFPGSVMNAGAPGR